MLTTKSVCGNWYLMSTNLHREPKEVLLIECSRHEDKVGTTRDSLRNLSTVLFQ